VKRGLERIDRDGDPVEPCSVSPWCGRHECVLEDVQGAQRSLPLATDVCSERVERAEGSG
jgi:hypothetical protein